MPEFLDIDITMAQAKILMSARDEREMQMSELVRRSASPCPRSAATSNGSSSRASSFAATTPPTAARSSSPPPRPRTSSLERFRELNAAQTARAARPPDTHERSRGHRPRRPRTPPGDRSPAARRRIPPHRPKGIVSMSRLSQFAVSKRSVTLLLAGGPLHRRHLGLGHPQAGAPAGHRVPGHHGRRAVPGRRRRPMSPTRSPSRSSAPSPACRGSRSLQSTSANSIALVVAQFAFGTDVKAAQADDQGRTCARPACRTVEPQVNGAQHQRLAGDHRARSRPPIRGRPGRRSPRSPGPRSCPRSAASRASPRADVTGGLEDQLLSHARPGQAGRGRRHRPADHGRPPGEQPHAPVRPAVGRAGRRSRCRRSASSTSVEADRGPRRRVPQPATAAPAGAGPGASGRARVRAPAAPQRPVRRRAGRADPDHHRRPRHGRAGRGRRRPAIARTNGQPR